MKSKLNIFNSNTIDSALTNATVTTDAVTVPTVFAFPLDLGATRVRPPIKSTGTHITPYIVSLGSSQTDAANFQIGDAVIDDIQIEVQSFSKSTGISSPESNQFLTPDHITASLAMLAAEDIFQIYRTKVVAGSFGAPDVSALAANLDADDLQTLMANNASPIRTLLANTAAFGGLAPSLQLGVDGYEYPGVQSVWETNVAIGDAHSILVAPQAFAYIVERPQLMNIPQNELYVSEIVLPILNIPAWWTRWFDKATRTQWQSVDLLFGLTAANPAALSYAAAP